MRVTPWYGNTVEFDRKRTAQVNATIQGLITPKPAEPGTALLTAAMMHDADLFRAAIEILSLLALPQEVMARPGVMDRIIEVRTPLRDPRSPRDSASQ